MLFLRAAQWVGLAGRCGQPHLALILVALVLGGCEPALAPSQTQPPAERSDARNRIAVEEGCSAVKYGPPRELARVADKRITESSGIARSIRRPGHFWTHNDGNAPRLYCINERGETVGFVKLEGATFDDCEDVASFQWSGPSAEPAAVGGAPYLLYADTGDNELSRREYRLHLIEEPVLKQSSKRSAKKPQEAPVAMSISFRYPDGPHDCEAVAVDPQSAKVYLATKERQRGCLVYELDLPETAPEEPLVARYITRLATPPAAALDISPDGRRAVLLTDNGAYEFERREGQDWPAAFGNRLCRLKMPPRENGESICYGDDGKSLYLTSEGARQALWQVPAVE